MKYYKELLTIGIPAYNEEKYLLQTIESCINQAGTVILSDNASTDNTQKICEELAKKYSNFKYIRQEKNIGEIANYNFVLEKTQTKYFMWMGAHDFLDKNYTMHMLHMLENSDAIGCVPVSRAVDNDNQEIGTYDCWYADRLVSDSPSQRVYSLIAHLHDVAAIFGIYRSEFLKKEPMKIMLGNDHVVVCAMAALGRIIYSPRSVFNWRQTKWGFSDEKNIKIWQDTLGDPSKKTSGSRKAMQEEQLKILKKCGIKGYGFFGKLYLNFKAKRKLKKRFG